MIRPAEILTAQGRILDWRPLSEINVRKDLPEEKQRQLPLSATGQAARFLSTVVL